MERSLIWLDAVCIQCVIVSLAGIWILKELTEWKHLHLLGVFNCENSCFSLHCLVKVTILLYIYFLKHVILKLMSYTLKPFIGFSMNRRDDSWFAALGRSCIHMTWSERGAISLEVYIIPLDHNLSMNTI